MIPRLRCDFMVKYPQQKRYDLNDSKYLKKSHLTARNYHHCRWIDFLGLVRFKRIEIDLTVHKRAEYKMLF